MIYVNELSSQPELGYPQVTCMIWSDTSKDELIDFMKSIHVHGFTVFYIHFTHIDMRIEYCRLTPSQRERAISNNACYLLFEEYVELREKGYQYRLF